MPDLSRTGWIISADGIWNGSFAAANAIDGNTATCWHSGNGGGAPTPYPHYLIVDMGSAQTFDAIRFVPRTDSRNSDPAQVALYVSDDGVTWGSPIATATWVQDAADKFLTFAPVTKRYFKLQGNTDASIYGNMACGEIYALSGSASGYSRWRLNVFNISGHSVVSLADWKLYDASSTLIPTTSGTASASDSTYGSQNNAFDGNAGTFWASAYAPSPSAPQWLQYQFAAPVDVASFSLTSRSSGEYMQSPDSFALLGSNDGVTWTTVGYFSAGWSANGQVNTFTVSPPRGFGDAYRLLMTSNDGGPVFAVAEWGFKDAGGSTIPLVGAAVASSVFNDSASNGPSNAFDGVTGNQWASFDATSGQWLAYRFSGSPGIGSFTITARSSIANQTPKVFKLQKSIDGGSVWTDVQSYTAATWTAGQTQTFTVGPPPAAYTYWRLQVNNIGSNVCVLSDWKFYDVAATQIPTTGGTASASNILGTGWEAANAFDNNASTAWATGYPPTPVAPAYIQYQFASAVAPATFTLTARSSEPEQMPNAFTLLASNDGSTWTTIANYGAMWVTASETKTFTVGSFGLGDIYRIALNSNGGGAVYQMAEVKFYDAGASLIPFTNGAASAANVFTNPGAGKGPSAAVDGSASTAWISHTSGAPFWWQFRFNGSVTVGSFSIQAPASSAGDTPVTFDLQKSTNGGSSFTTLQSYTSAAWTAGEIRTFTVAIPASIVIAPSSGEQGETISLAVTGTGTHFSGATTVAVSGTGVTVGAVSVASATSLTVPLTIAAGASADARIIAVTTGAEVATAAFTVVAVDPCPKRERGTISPEQIQAALRQGNSPIVLMAKGEFVAGNVLTTDDCGNAVDSGGVGGGIPIEINGDVVGEAGVAGGASPVVGFVINDGSAGTNIGPMLAAARAGAFQRCFGVVKAADGSTALTFTIKRAGVSVFAAPGSVSAGAASGTVFTIPLSATPLPVALHDVFTMDISSGGSAWKFTAQLE